MSVKLKLFAKTQIPRESLPEIHRMINKHFTGKELVPVNVSISKLHEEKISEVNSVLGFWVSVFIKDSGEIEFSLEE